MNHKLKALGLVLVAVFVMSAMATSAASAQQGKLTSDGPVTLETTETGEPGSGVNAYTTLGIKLECPGSFLLTGHKINVTPHEFIPNGASEFTVTPHANINTCTNSSGLPTTWLMNACDYVLHIGDTVAADEYAVTTDVICPPGKHIQLEQFNKHPGGIRLCTFTIKPQNGLAGAHLIANTATLDLSLVGTFKNIHIEQSGLCGSKTSTTAEFHIDATVKGTDSIGKTTEISISE